MAGLGQSVLAKPEPGLPELQEGLTAGLGKLEPVKPEPGLPELLMEQKAVAAE